ncbi:MAG: SNF2-related protein [Saprospiraceae bacterium]
MRKSYGNTWWGKQWLNALADIDYSNRLPRGRTYANKGLVKEIHINGSKITAKVQGSRRSPYQVDFVIPTFTSNEKSAIIEIVTSNPLYLSQLLNRSLPIALHDVCQRIGIDIFPNTWEDLEGRCSCPDWAVPCKHMAAVLYLIANEIDQNPFLVFQLHDFNLFQGLEEIGYATEAQKEIPTLTLTDLQQDFSLEKTTIKWDDDVYDQLDFSQIPNCQEDLMAILTDKPVFYPVGDFKAILKKGYTSVTKATRAKHKVAEFFHDPTHLDPIEAVELLLDTELDFLTAQFRDTTGNALFVFDELPTFVTWLKQIPLASIKQFSPPLKSISLIYRFAEQLAQHSAYLPQLLEVQKGRYKVRWIPANLNPIVRSIQTGINSIVSPDLLFYKKVKEVVEPIEEDKIMAVLALFLNHSIKTHHNINSRFREHKVGHLFFNGAVVQFPEQEEREYPAAIQLWLHKYAIAKKQFVPVVQIDEEEEGFEVKLSVQDKTKPLADLISLGSLLSHKKYQEIRLAVLRDLAMLAEYFPQISDLVAAKGEKPLLFNPDSFAQILFKILPTIRLFGIKVLLPKALQKLLRPKLSVAISTEGETGVIQKASLLNMDEILGFQWQIAVGDQLLNQKEFLALVQKFSGIVKLNDQYVFFDENEIQLLLKQLNDPPPLATNQLLQIALTEDYEGAKVKLDQKLKKLLDRLRQPEEVDLPTGLRAILRPYQLSGYQWLYKNANLGFGSLIADDMGLGKTLQVITTLLKFQEEGLLAKKKALIVVPTTLLTNWEKEIKKFAPDIIPHIYHGSKRDLAPMVRATVLITTYGVVRSDLAILKKQHWQLIAIDEAQNIKNPTATQAKAIKQLKANIKIAMSGTPVENRLSEYWSIFDFANKGYLGSLAKFKKDFAKPIEVDRDQQQLDRFRKITQPFILRRLKSDRSIIKDLPDKIEKDQFCHLTATQSALYQNVVDSTLQTIAQAEGIARRGLVLKLLTALKQICNHPKQFLKKGATDANLSGKSVMLLEIMKQILAQGEKTLIFTQYQVMGKLIAELLQEAFQLEVPFLHGGVSRKKRDKMVDTFQHNRATRVMILSLKAGGTGLNLTAASNVIHYDLWWNPAVEAQATDRAYRIGQQNNVMVHRFITQATFEEKINELLLSKKELASLTVSTGESWIGDLDDTTLKELVTLS